MSSTNDNNKENTKNTPAKQPTNKIDESSLDLQQTINNFSLFYGDISAPPSVHEQKILNDYDLLVLDFDKVACRNLSKLRKQGGKTLARVSLLSGGNGSGSTVAIDIEAGDSSEQTDTSPPITDAQGIELKPISSPTILPSPSSPKLRSSSSVPPPSTTEASHNINSSPKNSKDLKNSTNEASSSESVSQSIPPPPPLPTAEQLAKAGSSSSESASSDSQVAPPPPPPPLPTAEQLAKAGSSKSESDAVPSGIPPPPPLPTAEQLAKAGSSKSESDAAPSGIPPPPPLPTAEQLAKAGSSKSESDAAPSGIPPPPPLPTAEQLAKAGSSKPESDESKPESEAASSSAPPPPPPLPTAEQLAKAGTAESSQASSSSSSSTPSITDPSVATSPAASSVTEISVATPTTAPVIPVVADAPKTRVSAVSSMGGKLRKSSNKEYTNGEQLIRLVKALKGRAGVDGIYITDIDKAVEQYGREQIEYVVAQLIDEVNTASTPMIIMVDGGAFFAEHEWLPSQVHGVIIHNPTLHELGDFKLLPREELTNVLEAAKIQTQRRVDFVTLAQEKVQLDNIRSGMVRRFVKFCQESKMVASLCVDPTMSRPEMVHPTPTNPMGPLAVFSAPFFDDYFKSFRTLASLEGKNKAENDPWQKVMVKEAHQFAKSMGHEVDPTSLQQAFVVLREQHKHSAYAVWLGLLSHVYHTLATTAAASPETTPSQDIYEESSNILRLMVEWEESRHPVETSIKTVASAPLVAQAREDDWAAKLVEEDPAGPAGGQREIGMTYRPAEFRRVVQIQEKLRHKGLLKNLSKTITRETPEGKVQAHEVKFAEALDILERIVSSPDKHAEVLSGFTKEKDYKKAEILKQISELRTGLTQFSDNKEHYMIQVWECDPQSLRFNSYSGDKRYFSVSNFDDVSKVLHVYIGRHHPNIAEALVYSYFSLKGFSHTCCVLLEVLCRRPTMPSIHGLSTTRWDKYTILSERMAWQLTHSTYKDLARHVMQTHKILLQLKESNITSRQRYLAVKMAFQLKAAAKFLLLDDLQFREESVRQNKAVLQYKIGNQDNILQNRLEAVVQEAAWRDEPNQVLKNLVACLNKGMMFADSASSGIPKFVFDVLVGTGRAAALEELEMQVRDANKYLLREPDLVTVYLEFNGLNETDSQRLFGLPRFELGRVIYSRIREKMEDENPALAHFEVEKGAYEPAAAELLSTKNFFLRWGDGLFFMLFMAINLAVVLPTGVGAYTSIHMTGAQNQIIAIAMISAFITAGPINAAISRLGSLYLYQWSFSLAFTLISRFISCGLLFAACICIVAGIPVVIAHDAYNGAIFIMYFFLFVAMLLLMGSLFNIHNGSIWFSVEGWCVLGAQFLEIGVVFAIFYGLGEDVIDGPLVHIIGLAVCVLVLGISFFLLAHKHTMYISHITPTSEKDVLAWYQTVTGVESPPLATATDAEFADWYTKLNGQKSQNQPVVVRWAKKMAAEIWSDARVAFAEAIKKESVLKMNSAPVIVERAKNYKHEELLMKWYILLTSKPRPAPFSKQWDIIIAEAKDAYLVKTKTDSVLRGGLLWEAVAPYMMQGTFYYCLLFTDRIIQLIYTGSAKWFVPTSAYELTEGWALICLLLAIGSLEAIPIRISAFELSRPLRLSSNTSDIQLIKAYNKFLMRSYWSDMARIFAVFVSCAAIGLGFLVLYARETTLVGSYNFNTDLNLYCIFAFGYCGFVMGCYNALYISRYMAFVAKSLAGSTVFGVVIGLIISEAMSNSDASATGLVAGGWAYFGITAWKVLHLGHFGRERKVEAKWGALQNPAMMTSGQKWVGTPWEETADSTNPKVAHLLEHLFKAKNVVLTPTTDIGLEVANILRKSHENWDGLTKDCLLKTAFPQAGSMFTTLLELWSKEKIILSVVEEGDLKFSEDEGFAAFSVALNVEKVAKEDNRTLSRELSYDIRTSSGIVQPDDQTPKVLQIYVALNEFQPAQRLAEALVHEFAEQYLGMSHTRAVTSELLVSPGDGTNVYLPVRIRRQIAAGDRTKLLQLTDQTEDVVLDCVAEDALLTQWESLSPAARTLVVAILEIPVFCALAPQHTPSPAPDWICTRAEISDNMFSRGIADLQREGLWPIGDQREHLANITLSAQLAIAVKKIAVETVSSRMMSYAEHHAPIVSNVPRYTGDDNVMSPSEDLMKRLVDDGVAGTFKGFKPHADAFLRLGFLAFTADPTFAQEYAYSHSHDSTQGGLGVVPRACSTLFVPIFNASRKLTSSFLWSVLLTRRNDFKLLHRQINNGAYGNETYQNNQITRVQHNNPGIPNRTGFVIHSDDGNNATMNVYPQLVETEPANQRGRIATVVYRAGRAERLIEYAPTGVKSVAVYTYDRHRYPTKEVKYACNDANAAQSSIEAITQGTMLTDMTYDSKGRPSEATIFRDFRGAKVPIKANYTYHADDIDSEPTEIVYSHVPEETLEGEVREVCISVHYYTFTQRIEYVDWQYQDASGNLLRTYFNYRNLNHVKQATFKQSEDGSDFRQRFLTPNVIRDDPYKLLKHQFVSVRQAVLAPYLTKRHFFWRSCYAGKKPWSRELKHGSKYPTLKARIVLWKSWQKGKLEGVFIQMWDEHILRSEKSMWKYWFLRDWGKGVSAQVYLREKQHLVTPRIQPEASHPDLRTHTMTKISDLLSLVPGGYMHDMVELENNYQSNKLIGSLESEDALDVVGIDSGTWPADGGGVAACRRDVVDRLSSISWTQFSEIGNPMKLTQYQIERNIRSLTLIPLWGDIVNDPCALLLTDIPYGLLAARRWRTTPKAIEKYFMPILLKLVEACSIVVEPTDLMVEEQTTMIVNMYTYFQEFDWIATWNDPLVIATWRSGWCNAYGPEVRQEYIDSTLLDAELPTMQDLDVLISLFGHFLFPITAKLPPYSVYHASHHGIQSILGVVARHIYGSQFIIWDHGMLWREKVKALAELSQFSMFVRNGLLGLSRLAMRVNFENANTITSCCTKGNPDWEIWLGGRNQGLHTKPRQDMYWRMSPVLNGMETDKFHPRPNLEAQIPTVVQLSHVYDLKDIKTAIRSASVIVNQFKVTNFNLAVYGSTTKDLDYTAECRELISAEGLSANVFLMGLADATKVLGSGWLFFNSSQSEGLPLALGEAGLCALPVICTDVGGSREVVTGDITYGKVVPPRNPYAAARGILEVLAMCTSKELDEFLKNPQSLSDRMEATETIRKRRELGNKFRTFVQENFGMERYLREHEQQLWLGHFRCAERRVEAMTVLENVCVRQCNPKQIRHIRREIIPEMPNADSLGKAEDLPLYDLYADAPYRMIETAIEKNKLNFLKELASRNNAPIPSVKTIAPFNPPPQVMKEMRRRNSYMIKYYMSPAVFLPKNVLGSSSPAFHKPARGGLGMSMGASGNFHRDRFADTYPDAMSPRSPAYNPYGDSSTPHFPNSPGNATRTRHVGPGVSSLLTSHLMEMFEKDPDRKAKVQELVGALVGRLGRVANIDDLIRNMDAWIDSSMTSLSAEEIRKQLEELQIIICDETKKYSEQDKDAANIQYERVFKALTQTSEYQAEIARIAEEKRRINEPLNRAAWEAMIKIFSKENIKNDPEVRDKLKQNPELGLICMDPKAIGAKHQGDFQMYTLNNLDQDCLRAIRAILPKWRSDQKRQQDWQDGLENKIEQMAKAPPKAPRPPKAPSAAAGGPKPPPKAKKPAAAAAPPTGDVFAELLARRKRLN